MPTMLIMHDLPGPDGVTPKERNLKRQHRFAVGDLVELEYSRWLGGGACERVRARLWIVVLTRDCDGTPMYRLSEYHPDGGRIRSAERGNFSEDDWHAVEVTEEMASGETLPEWFEE